MINQMKIVKSKAYKDRLRGHKESVITLYYPQGMGELLYSFSKDGFIRVWDLDKRVITNKFVLSRNPELELPNEQENFKEEQGENKEEKQQKAEENKEKDKDKETTETFTAAVFTNQTIFAASQDGSINEWSLSTHQIKNSFKGHDDRISDLALIPTEKLLVSAGKDSTIRTWSTAGNSENEQTKSKEPISEELVYKVSGAVTAMRINFFEIHALVSRHIFYQINAQKKEVIRFIDFSFCSFSTFIMNQDILYIGNIENKLDVFDLSTYDPTLEQNKLKPVQTIQGAGGWILSMKISEDKLYCGCDDKKIRVYDIKEGTKIEQVEQLVGHDDGVISIEFINKMMYTGSYDQSIRTWEIDEMVNRIRERKVMEWESLESKKFQTYYGIAFKGKKKKPAKKKK